MNRYIRSTLLLLPLLWISLGYDASGQDRSAIRTIKASAASSLSHSDSSRAIAKLQTDLESIISLSAELKKRTVGVSVVSVKSGRPLYALNAAKPLTPASTTKLITAYSALLLFGSDYDIATIAFAGKPPRDGVLKGDLYIKGHGDPLLSINDIDALVDKIKAAGIKRIEGSIVGDGTFFDDVYERKDYSGDDDHVVNLPPVAGLAIENNMVTVVVSSSRKSGQLCNVQTFPPSSGFTIVNSAKSYVPKQRRKKRRRSSIDGYEIPGTMTPQAVIGRFGDQEYYEDDMPDGTEGAEEAGVAISITADEEGRQIVRVSGTLGVNKTISKRYEIQNPPLVVAGMFYDRLRTRGIAITGSITTGTTPVAAHAVAEFSRPLMQVLSPMMKNSDNHYAEYVFKMIGAVATRGTEGHTADFSRTAIRQCMEACPSDFGKCLLNDGSGLSRRNLITAEALTGTLVMAYHNPNVYRPLYSTMSVAGVDGTLRKRMKKTRAQGNVHGKTGTLRNVSALSGYVTTADGEMLGFAALMNGYSIGSYKDVQDRIAVRLSEFSYAEGIIPDGQ